MLIADSQIHLWAADRPDRPWPPGGAQRAQKPYPVDRDMALAGMKEAGVDRAVIVPPSWEGERNDVALEAARLHPDRFAVMGRFPLERPDNRRLVDGWRRQPGMLGMRFTFNTAEQRPWLTDGTADWLWPAAERAAIPIMMSVSGQLAAVDRIAARHPTVRLVIDHMGLRGGTKGIEAFAGLSELCGLARHANVAVKASALPCYSVEPYPFADVHAHIRRVYDSFGPRRMFWGTDWTRLPCPWRQAVTLFTEELPWLSSHDKEWIMGRALCDWLDWPMPRSA
jgi:predicted TIM-barrel fold metal-dependent hydrolase